MCPDDEWRYSRYETGVRYCPVLLSSRFVDGEEKTQILTAKGKSNLWNLDHLDSTLKKKSVFGFKETPTTAVTEMKKKQTNKEHLWMIWKKCSAERHRSN